jgi:hypothetical protein
MASISQKLVISAAGWATLATLVNTPLANAAIIVNNVANDAQIAGYFVSDLDRSLVGVPAQQGADRFTLTKDAEISEIIWNGRYFDSGTPLVDDFTIRFFEIVQGTVSSEPIVELHLGSVARTASSIGFNLFDYYATLTPLSLKRGNYLFSVVNNTTGQLDDWAWTFTLPQDLTNCEQPKNFDCVHFYREKDGEAWRDNFSGNMAFAIAGNTVSTPEPSTILGFLIVLGIGAISRKSKTK